MKLKASVMAMGFVAFASSNVMADEVAGSSRSIGEQAAVTQTGDRNSATLDQQNSSYDAVSVFQSTNGAVAKVTSKAGGGNWTSIVQTTLPGAGGESASTATITQDGAFNTKNAVLQVGDNHQVAITQSDSKGDSNRIGQVGASNTATITQTRTSSNFIGIDQGTFRSAGQVSGARAEVIEDRHCRQWRSD